VTAPVLQAVTVANAAPNVADTGRREETDKETRLRKRSPMDSPPASQLTDIPDDDINGA